VHAPHYWSEPRFGYYRPDDARVIRKQMQMLGDAGVDVLILDATNGFTYDAEREALCLVLEQMQAEGRRVPQIAMFAYAQQQRGRAAFVGDVLQTGEISLNVVPVEGQAAHADADRWSERGGEGFLHAPHVVGLDAGARLVWRWQRQVAVAGVCAATAGLA